MIFAGRNGKNTQKPLMVGPWALVYFPLASPNDKKSLEKPHIP